MAVLRGYGTTRFLDAKAIRNGEPAALATDVIALMDALKIDKATLAGYDWGARTADIVAALWPERVKAKAETRPQAELRSLLVKKNSP